MFKLSSRAQDPKISNGLSVLFSTEWESLSRLLWPSSFSTRSKAQARSACPASCRQRSPQSFKGWTAPEAPTARTRASTCSCMIWTVPTKIPFDSIPVSLQAGEPDFPVCCEGRADPPCSVFRQMLSVLPVLYYARPVTKRVTRSTNSLRGASVLIR